MGSSPSSPTFDPDDRPPQPSLPEYIASYFSTQPTGPITHVHAVSGARLAATTAILLQRVPLEIAQTILEHAHLWSACARACSREITVYATGAQPQGTRGIAWGNGQEDEVPGLEVMDSPGRVWCLVSAPVGCDGAEGGERGDEGGGRRGRGRGENRGGKGEMDGRERDEDDEMTLVDQKDKDAPRQTAWVRAIVIEMFSKDQGWVSDDTNYGTYNGSFSWFEVSLLRDGNEVPGSRRSIQHNVVAGQYYKSHRVILDSTHPLVRAARDGDRIVLWARAQYPGWANHVKRTAMTVYTAQYAQRGVRQADPVAPA